MEMENRHTWMQRSLKQTAKLGLNVLERAKRREVDWSSLCSGGGQIHREQQSMENPEGVATGHLQPASKQRTSQDVRIEVAPGTYSISAGSCHSQRQTHVVNITPGQSVDLTFNL
ncbi:hypothetical protein FKM82_003209 [Ascaphus truei]